MKKFLFSFIFLFTLVTFSQTKPFKISGTITAEEDKTPLESATVYLERVKDSSLISYTISNAKGEFVIEDETGDASVNLFVSFVGYKTHVQTLDLNRDNLDQHSIALGVSSNALDEIVIKSVAPITIKKDTLEFNVKSFKTKKDASVEDLLKQLPGVEVDEDGKITVNGKEVNKILVNGKPFFGDDPTITTKNLTKDIIEKIQIVDTKTKSEAFSGEQGSEDNKTINLTINEENNKGVFGRVSAGGGTDDRYEFAGMMNYFDNDQRISVLVGGNNTNSPGFSFGEIRKMFGGGRSMSMNSNGAFTIDGRSFGGASGITTSNNAGVNYADELGEKVDLSFDYFYSGSSSADASSNQRENILPDSRYFTNSNSNSTNDNDSHSANLGFDIKVDSTFLINISPSFSKTNNLSDYSSNGASLDSDSNLTNESLASSISETDGNNFSNDIDVTKRFGNKGAFLKFSISNQFNTTNTDDFLNSNTRIYGQDPNDINNPDFVLIDEINRNQFTDGENKLTSFNSNVSYRLSIKAKELFLDFKYNYNNSIRKNRRSTFDFENATQNFTEFNTDLSTDFEYINERSAPSLGITYRKDKLSTSLNASYVFRTLENKDALRPALDIKRNFKALELRANFRYRFSPKASTYTGYNLSNDPPDLSQLQPFQDVSNPLNTVSGNPNLEPSNRHRLYFGYNAFDFQKRTGFYTYVSTTVTENQVVSKTVIDENLIRETTYANVNGNYRFYGSMNYNKSVKLDTLKTLKYGLQVYGNVNKTVNFNNGVQYASKVNSITPSASITFTWKDVLEIRPRYRITFTKNTYDIESFEDRNLLFHSVDIRTATFLPKNFEWRNDIKFNYDPNIAEGFQKSAWFWNSTLAYSVLKDKGVVTLKVYDLLNQNTNARRTVTQDYIQDSQSTVLEQYFMLSFSWKFNSLGKKGESNGNDMFYFD